MIYKVFFRPEAEDDMEEAAIWYEQQKPGLGQEFLELVQGQCGILEQPPEIYPIVHRQTRRTVLHRFPFGLYYKIEG